MTNRNYILIALAAFIIALVWFFTRPAGAFYQECEEACDITPVISPEVTPEVTPEITPEPTATQSAQVNTGGPGDGLSDGKSDGRSSCPECTKNHNGTSVPLAAPKTGKGS